MSEARTYRCANCGGTTDERSRLCSFCSAPVATLRCSYCFHMNVPESLHCSGCGRELGLEPIGRRGELSCPHCKVALEGFGSECGRLHDCSRCGGQFVEHGLLRELLERRQVVGEHVPRRLPQEHAPGGPVRYVPCPACGHLMNRRNFGGSSGVIVDVCSSHGLWFDLGELPRVLSFVEAGGLARAKLREAEANERRAAALASARSAPGAMLLDERTAIVGGGLAEAGMALLDFVATLVRDR